MSFDEKALVNKRTGDKSLIGLPKSPAIIASDIPTKFLPENLIELCDRLKLLLQEKHARNNSNIINEETVGPENKFLDYKCISMKQHKLLLLKFLN